MSQGLYNALPGLHPSAHTQQQLAQAGNGYQQHSQQPLSKPIQQKESPVNNANEILPDISITRVLKWAFVLLIAMGLGKKVWALFGDKITKQMHKALGEIAE